MIIIYVHHRNHMVTVHTGYCLPEVSFEYNDFIFPVYFSRATFCGAIIFVQTIFSGKAEFSDAEFSGETDLPEQNSSKVQNQTLLQQN